MVQIQILMVLQIKELEAEMEMEQEWPESVLGSKWEVLELWKKKELLSLLLLK